ncbi:5629_t:CDS:2 [Ambispora gerdemannii]|uniref:5629_t:CDS:1 n=1 Tax=Ambispora gerdemannii TaxID=144530 RepID=A0A9N9H214_9GLOM|nr:5629_t:CDS:2 [Ambispora gerdemannii]
MELLEEIMLDQVLLKLHWRHFRTLEGIRVAFPGEEKHSMARAQRRHIRCIIDYKRSYLTVTSSLSPPRKKFFVLKAVISTRSNFNMNLLKAHTLLSRTRSIASPVRLFQQSQVDVFDLTRSRQLLILTTKPQHLSTDKRKNTEKVLELIQDGVIQEKILITAGIGLVFSYLYFVYESLGALNSRSLMKRKNLENRLKSILQPSLDDLPSNYHLIVGEHGTGKTTLIQITIMNLQEPMSDVLILDQADRITKKGTEFIVLFQDFAKDGTDKHTLVIIFVSSEGLIPIITTRFVWSLANMLWKLVTSDEEVIKYLRDSGSNITPLKVCFKISNGLEALAVPTNHAIFIKLLEVHILGNEQAKTIMDSKTRRKLIEANILKESTDGKLSFYERCVETYFRGWFDLSYGSTSLGYGPGVANYHMRSVRIAFNNFALIILLDPYIYELASQTPRNLAGNRR